MSQSYKQRQNGKTERLSCNSRINHYVDQYYHRKHVKCNTLSFKLYYAHFLYYILKGICVMCWESQFVDRLALGKRKWSSLLRNMDCWWSCSVALRGYIKDGWLFVSGVPGTSCQYCSFRKTGLPCCALWGDTLLDTVWNQGLEGREKLSGFATGYHKLLFKLRSNFA